MAKKKDDNQEQGGRNEQEGAVENPSPQAKADETSYPVPNDAKLDQPPLRSPRAPEDLAASLSQGAGEHVPPDPDEYDSSGAPYSDTNPKPE